MNADVVLLPGELSVEAVRGRAVVVLDVLRATTSMAAALAAGVAEIRVFPDIGSARRASLEYHGPKLLCGEVACLRPEGFDLGNSPGDFVSLHVGRTVFMSTTNGTRAIIAARSAKLVLTGALVNVAAVARHVVAREMDVTLLCAGTNGRVAIEDMIGAGAILNAVAEVRPVTLESDVARMAVRLFREARGDLVGALRDAQGGRNVINAGLEGDIEFAARLNAIDAVGVVRDGPLRVLPAGQIV